MADKVVHLSDEVHTLAKQYCKETNIRMSVWISDLIKKTLDGTEDKRVTSRIYPRKPNAKQKAEPVDKGKVLPNLDDTNSSEDVAARDPFWDRQAP